jgi:hypothetical protein
LAASAGHSRIGVHDAYVRHLPGCILRELRVGGFALVRFLDLRDHDHDKPLPALAALVAHPAQYFRGKCVGMRGMVRQPELI